MAERIRRQRATTPSEQVQETEHQQSQRPAIDFDSLLDEIDTVLQGDAAEYVRSFVQKGGQ